MSDISPILGLPYLQPSQAQKHVTHNEALQVLDAVTQLVVEAFDAETPPTAVEDGTVYALGAAPNGAWAGHDGDLAIWRNTAWSFIAPLPGWRAWGKAEGDFRVWDGTGWVAVEGATQNLDGLGIQTHSDAQNRLAVSAANTLLTHEGAGHRLKINKAGAAETASLVFQSNWTGFAEMGLAGSEDFSIKVSPDGGSWSEALRFDGATGLASGAAVQSGPTDATTGRLLQVGAFGLGAVTPQEIVDIDDTALAPGFYRTGPLTANMGALPSPEGVLQVQAWDAASLHQTWISNATGEAFARIHSTGTWSDWIRRIDQARIVGTVSETGGAPTGAIVERGSNANGEYVRFADGTQICTRIAAVDVTSVATQSFAFARDFSAAPAVSFGHAAPEPNSALFMANIQTISGLAGQDQYWTVRLISAGVSNDPNSAAEKLSLTAHGRWY